MRAPARALVPLFAAAVAAAAPQAPGSGQQIVSVEPSRIEVTMLYKGDSVHVSAEVPAGAAVAIALTGEERRLTLKRKGKALGMVWMNVGEVTFEAVPDLYLLATSGPVLELAPGAVLERLGIGFQALDARSTPRAGDEVLFDELVRLKQRDGLWGVAEGGVTFQPGADGSARAMADFFLPAKASPGDYRALVYVFGDGQQGVWGEGGVRLERTGAVALISSLAERHGLLYGILAVVAAGAAGLLTGVVFGLGSRKGH